MAETSGVPCGRKTQRKPDLKEVHIIWINDGLSCDGDSIPLQLGRQRRIVAVGLLRPGLLEPRLRAGFGARQRLGLGMLVADGLRRGRGFPHGRGFGRPGHRVLDSVRGREFSECPEGIAAFARDAIEKPRIIAGLFVTLRRGAA